MNRRHFFGMTVAAVAAAGLPAIVLPERSIFLPPAHGWKPSELSAFHMREVYQYDLLSDSEFWRYDAVGRDIWGEEYQFHVDVRHDVPEAQRLDSARWLIGDRFRHDGLTALRIGESRQFKLQLPRTAVVSRYI